MSAKPLLKNLQLILNFVQPHSPLVRILLISPFSGYLFRTAGKEDRIL